MTEKKFSVKVGTPIFSHTYSGFFEKVIFSGMPSRDAFCLTYQNGTIDYGCSPTHSFLYNEPLFLPVGYSERIVFPSRGVISFFVSNVSPLELEATLTVGRRIN